MKRVENGDKKRSQMSFFTKCNLGFIFLNLFLQMYMIIHALNFANKTILFVKNQLWQNANASAKHIHCNYFIYIQFFLNICNF